MDWIKSLFDSDDEEVSSSDSDAEKDSDDDAIKYSFAAESVLEQDLEEIAAEKEKRRGDGGLFSSVLRELPTTLELKDVEDPVYVRKEQKRKELLEDTMSQLYFGLNDFQEVRTIGTGSFSRVKLIQHAGSKRLFAAKQMPKKDLVHLKQVGHILREKDILCTYVNRSQFIVQMECYFQDPQFLYFVTEFVPGGELFLKIQMAPNRRLGEKQAEFYMAQLVLVLEHLHVRGIIHRDIKPENVCIGQDGYIKLLDFGFAKAIGNNPSARTHTSLGTPEYMCPECIQAVGHSKPVDFWCLGIILFEMLAGEVPFNEEDPFESYQKILKLDYEFPDFLLFALSGKDLISLLLKTNPLERLGASGGVGGVGIADFMKIKEHMFFTLDWAAVEDKTIKVDEEDLPPMPKPDDPGSNYILVPDDNTQYPAFSEKEDDKHFPRCDWPAFS